MSAGTKNPAFRAATEKAPLPGLFLFVLTVAFAVESAGGGLRFLYTIGAADHRDLSPLRYTALTAALGWLAYLALPGAVIAVLCWNAAVERLGRRRPRCFGNLIPVSTFAIETIRGYRPSPLDLVGALITVGALVANNLFARPRPAADESEAESQPADPARGCLSQA
jgi:drug/metabolite transporter (DMT)-like permease